VNEGEYPESGKESSEVAAKEEPTHTPLRMLKARGGVIFLS